MILSSINVVCISVTHSTKLGESGGILPIKVLRRLTTSNLRTTGPKRPIIKHFTSVPGVRHTFRHDVHTKYNMDRTLCIHISLVYLQVRQHAIVTFSGLENARE